jgi:hypothetical protein
MQIAKSEQTIAHLLADLVLTTGTYFKPTKVRVAYRQILTQISQTSAIWTIWITGQIILLRDFF